MRLRLAKEKRKAEKEKRLAEKLAAKDARKTADVGTSQEEVTAEASKQKGRANKKTQTRGATEYAKLQQYQRMIRCGTCIRKHWPQTTTFVTAFFSRYYKQQNEKLKEQLRQLKKYQSKSFRKQIVSEELVKTKYFTSAQARCYTEGTIRPSEWSKEDIFNALELIMVSRKAFKFIRKRKLVQNAVNDSIQC